MSDIRRNDRETLVAFWLRSQGVKVHDELGWPDLLCEGADGRIFAVEVKSLSDQVRPNQLACHQLLERAGIPVVVKYVDRNGTGLGWTEISDEELMRRLDIGIHEAHGSEPDPYCAVCKPDWEEED